MQRQWPAGFGRPAAATSPEQKAGHAIVLETVKQNGTALSSTTPEHRADDATVLAAVKQNGLALRFTTPEHKADYTIVHGTDAEAVARGIWPASAAVSPEHMADSENGLGDLAYPSVQKKTEVRNGFGDPACQSVQKKVKAQNGLGDLA